ncbi:MAG TPA: NAD(P)H-dependent oxidoreductase [Candidatus Saccharimonadales bacterium]|nr:NAD(P)H-dependent oxidoreductase [Candidatus Saccharimonadales bacterium]
MEASTPRIKVILGSVRQNRFGVQPAQWIMDLSKGYPQATFELVDLAEQQLPIFADVTPPSMVSDGNYEKESTQKWAGIVAEADGFIIITPEYNYGVPAGLKNAIDTVSNEWNYKPVAFVSYGTAAGGSRAVEHLRGSAGWLKMYDLREQVIIANYWGQLDQNGNFTPTEPQIHGAQAMLEAVAFWAEKMKPIRQELGDKQ